MQHGKLISSTSTKGNHPGEILRDDFLGPMKISVCAMAQVIKVPRSRANGIMLDRRAASSFRVNDQWRVIFRWVDGDAYEV